MSHPRDASGALTLASALCQALRRVLTPSLLVWWKQSAWQPWLDGEPAAPADEAEQEAILGVLAQQAWDQQAITLAWPDGRHLLLIPVNEAGMGKLVVAGLLETNTPDLITALAETTLLVLRQRRELEERSQRLDECIFQITSDFEELDWLRSVAAQFELSSGDDGLDRVAQATLPSLRELIGAESIYLFRCEPESTPGDAYERSLTLSFADGALELPVERVRQVIVEGGSKHSRQPFVWNAPNGEAPQSVENNLRNLILTPMIANHDLLGWIVAVNKQSRVTDEMRAHATVWDRNLFEFGTNEASLVSTLSAMLATHRRNVELLHDKGQLLIGLIRTLINTIDAKDAYTWGHSDRVASMSQRLARQMGLSEQDCEQIHMAGLLHDIGKIGVPDEILGKSGQLTEEEFAIIKTHPVIGYEILLPLKRLNYVLPGVLHHHEALDGSGYPHGLKGDQIPLQGRIIAVADSYDAMTSDRPYRKGLPIEKAEQILRGGMGTQWDPQVGAAFFAAVHDMRTICGKIPKEAEERTGRTAENSPSGVTADSPLASVGVPLPNDTGLLREMWSSNMSPALTR